MITIVCGIIEAIAEDQRGEPSYRYTDIGKAYL